MLRIPLYLVVAQWALLGALGVFVFVLFRQLGQVLYGNAKPAVPGPPVGSQAAPLSYVRPGEQVPRQLTPGGGQPLLLAFVDPTCPSCEELVRVLDAISAAGEFASVRFLLMISDPVSYLQISAAFGATELEIARPWDPAGLDAYQVSGTPLLVAIDETGAVRAAGSAIRPALVRQYCQACVSGVGAQAAGPAVAANGRQRSEP
jgi:hypothetical protein